MIDFYKYQGTGNDFILIDNSKDDFKANKVDYAIKWCDRKFGIGADGLIFIEPSTKGDFLMDFYNPDGSQSFCGNGSRCSVAFAKFLGIIKDQTNFEAIDGMHQAVISDKHVKIEMQQYGAIESIGNDHFIDTGSPHYVAYRNGVNENIVEYGKSIRYSDRFKTKGTNVNLIAEKGDRNIEIWTYERGVEAETLACGTGATACGISFAQKHNIDKGIIEVKAQGGHLRIHLEASKNDKVYQNIWLEGPAEFVFKGVIEDEN
ncbi:diaminopimelate epimerase [Crocinitomix catalasitica]|uniref:diaminopimelate epimerase n=1 Tax=Crocinitomix catalasitica TaxID=184607 RepID=UPI00047F913B|nr:diaminopimelate epimerase [Crocinitomix catalasitica]